MTDPRVVEVLSPSTMPIDRGAEFGFHRGLPSLRHVVFVDQRQNRVGHVRRSAEGSTLLEPVRATDRLDLDAGDLSITLDRLRFEGRRCGRWTRPRHPPEGPPSLIP